MRMICLFSVLCFWGCQSHAGEQELRVPLGEVGIERICVTQSGVIVGAKTSLDIVVEKKSSKAVPRLVLRKYDVMAEAASAARTEVIGLGIRHWSAISHQGGLLIAATDVEGTSPFESPNNPLARLWLIPVKFAATSPKENILNLEEARRSYGETRSRSRRSWVRLGNRDLFQRAKDVVLVAPGLCVGLTPSWRGPPDYKPKDVVWVKQFSTQPLKWEKGGRRLHSGQISHIAATRAGENLFLAVSKREEGLAILMTAPGEGQAEVTQEKVVEVEQDGKATIDGLSTASLGDKPIMLVATSAGGAPSEGRLAFYIRDPQAPVWRVQQERTTKGIVRSASIGVAGGHVVYAYVLQQNNGNHELYVGKIAPDVLWGAAKMAPLKVP